MSPIRLVTFDLDDTLFPERMFVRSGFRVVSEFLVEEGIVAAPLFGQMEAAFDAGVRGRIFDQVLRDAGVEPTAPLVAKLVDVYRTHRSEHGCVRPSIRLYEDAQRALARLAGREVALGLISDGPLAAQQSKVAALGLRDWMEAIILTGGWGREFWKPHPRAFLEMASMLSVEPGDAVYVADNPEKDFQGPAAAHWRPSVWVRRPETVYRDAPAPAAGLVAATICGLDELESVLEKACP